MYESGMPVLLGLAVLVAAKVVYRYLSTAQEFLGAGVAGTRHGLLLDGCAALLRRSGAEVHR
ncbi:hypothetical protein GCM10012286_22140 [Streptomyces lasiicapitis]|uniref:Uncharacterized protein n=1 Tax=Streptomyces lasiicapitis TaxID=1923961 RepID=A0ABQ2LPY6_9ACTN|nr:hypothetical protein GCM10012286_22140 [Streptomyces lasiicapitis]